ncbi:MAG: hypothetical protein ABIE23_03815 [archaeon]
MSYRTNVMGVIILILVLGIALGVGLSLVKSVKYSDTEGYYFFEMDKSPDIMNINFFTRIVDFVLALALVVIAFLAYRRMQTKRMLLVFTAFAFFALKWYVKLLDVFLAKKSFFTDTIGNAFEFVILLLLFAALFLKK